MAMTGLLRLGEVGIRVLDIEEAQRHYDEYLGLHQTMKDSEGRLYFKTWDEHDHHCLVVRQADRPGIDYFAFKVASDATLDELEPKIRDFGLDVEHIDAGVFPKSGRRIQFELATGHTMQLYAEKEQLGNNMPTRNPGTIPDEGVIRGLRIIRLDHVLLGGVDVEEPARLFREVFGFTESEKLIDADSEESLVVFLSGSTKPHDVAFVKTPDQNKLHHISFLIESVNDVYHAADVIGKYRIPVDVGPTRHGLTRGATIYFFDPSGNRNEVFCGGYVYYPDNPTLIWDTSEVGPATFAHDNLPRDSFMNVLT